MLLELLEDALQSGEPMSVLLVNGHRVQGIVTETFTQGKWSDDKWRTVKINTSYRFVDEDGPEGQETGIAGWVVNEAFHPTHVRIDQIVTFKHEEN